MALGSTQDVQQDADVSDLLPNKSEKNIVRRKRSNTIDLKRGVTYVKKFIKFHEADDTGKLQVLDFEYGKLRDVFNKYNEPKIDVINHDAQDDFSKIALSDHCLLSASQLNDIDTFNMFGMHMSEFNCDKVAKNVGTNAFIIWPPALLESGMSEEEQNSPELDKKYNGLLYFPNRSSISFELFRLTSDKQVFLVTADTSKKMTKTFFTSPVLADARKAVASANNELSGEIRLRFLLSHKLQRGVFIELTNFPILATRTWNQLQKVLTAPKVKSNAPVLAKQQQRKTGKKASVKIDTSSVPAQPSQATLEEHNTGNTKRKRSPAKKTPATPTKKSGPAAATVTTKKRKATSPVKKTASSPVKKTRNVPRRAKKIEEEEEEEEEDEEDEVIEKEEKSQSQVSEKKVANKIEEEEEEEEEEEDVMPSPKKPKRAVKEKVVPTKDVSDDGKPKFTRKKNATAAKKKAVAKKPVTPKKKPIAKKSVTPTKTKVVEETLDDLVQQAIMTNNNSVYGPAGSDHTSAIFFASKDEVLAKDAPPELDLDFTSPLDPNLPIDNQRAFLHVLMAIDNNSTAEKIERLKVKSIERFKMITVDEYDNIKDKLDMFADKFNETGDASFKREYRRLGDTRTSCNLIYGTLAAFFPQILQIIRDQATPITKK